LRRTPDIFFLFNALAPTAAGFRLACFFIFVPPGMELLVWARVSQAKPQ
jgi:hypothetical protein